MAGPHPSGYGAGPFPYPGPLPPPVGYPGRVPRGGPGSRRVLWWSLLAVGIIGAIVAAAVFAGGNRSAAGQSAFTDSAAKAAIQNYLTALSTGDTETIALSWRKRCCSSGVYLSGSKAKSSKVNS